MFGPTVVPLAKLWGGGKEVNLENESMYLVVLFIREAPPEPRFCDDSITSSVLTYIIYPWTLEEFSVLTHVPPFLLVYIIETGTAHGG